MSKTSLTTGFQSIPDVSVRTSPALQIADTDTVPGIFRRLVSERSDQVTIWRKLAGSWASITWGEYGQWAEDLGNALIATGLNPGDKVSILSQTRVEWAAADMGIIGAGCVTAPIYHSNTDEQVRYIVEHSDSRLVFVEDQEQLDKMLAIWPELPQVEKLVVFDKYAPKDLENVVSLEAFREEGRAHSKKNPEAYNQRLEAVKPDDVVSFIYTSGTTGPPKAAMVTSRNILAIIKHLPKLVGLRGDDLTIAYLPLAHIAERDVGHFMKLASGNATVFAESIEDLSANLRQTGPTVMFGTPRIFEKFYARIVTGIRDATAFQRAVYNWALRVGTSMSDTRIAKVKPSFWLRARHALAHFLIFRKIRDLFGGRIKFMLSGGAPISPEIIRFFHQVGIDIYEVYGMTETTGLISMNYPGANRIGSVGKIFPDTEVRFDEDGEICSRGPQMCLGYYKNEKGTAELLEPVPDQPPWLHTGDIGRLDEEGYLFITDRKKDLLITAGGKNVAPQNIENLLKTSPYVSQAMVYGDRRPYLTALITLDEDEIITFARDQRIQYRDLPDLSQKPEVTSLIAKMIKTKNQSLASYESIKKFRILEEDFDQDRDEITPTLKIRRKVVVSRYDDLLQSMYRR